jgi:hypothetical protein
LDEEQLRFGELTQVCHPVICCWRDGRSSLSRDSYIFDKAVDRASRRSGASRGVPQALLLR